MSIVEEYEFFVMEAPPNTDGAEMLVVASGVANTRRAAIKEVNHYILEYSQDTDVIARIERVVRELISEIRVPKLSCYSYQPTDETEE